MSLVLSAIGKSLKAAVTAPRLLGAYTKGFFLKILEIAPDSLNVSELIARAFGKPLSDSASVSDDESRQFGKFETDSFGVTDNDTLEVGKNLANSSSVAEAIDKFDFGKNPSETAVTSETQSFDVTKLITDNTFATDDFDGEASLEDDQEMQFTKVRTDTAFVAESFDRTVAFDRGFTDLGSTSDDQSFAVEKPFSEFPSVTENFTRVITVDRSFTESPTASELYVSSFGKALTDSGIATESEVKSIGKIASDSASAVDSGSLISQGYTVDNTYFAEDYVGDSRTFT